MILEVDSFVTLLGPLRIGDARSCTALAAGAMHEMAAEVVFACRSRPEGP